MRLIPIIALIVLIPGAASAADGLRCEDFKRLRNGSWKNVRDVDTSAPDHPKGHHFPRGLVFTSGDILDGLDVGSVLDERCGKRVRSIAR